MVIYLTGHIHSHARSHLKYLEPAKLRFAAAIRQFSQHQLYYLACAKLHRGTDY